MRKSDAIGLLKVGENSKMRPTERAYEARGSLEVRHKILSLYVFIYTVSIIISRTFARGWADFTVSVPRMFVRRSQHRASADFG